MLNHKQFFLLILTVVSCSSIVAFNEQPIMWEQTILHEESFQQAVMQGVPPRQEDVLGSFEAEENRSAVYNFFIALCRTADGYMRDIELEMD